MLWCFGMKTCVHCSSETIEKGEFRMRKSGLDWILWGFGSSSVYFRGNNSSSERLIMQEGGASSGIPLFGLWDFSIRARY